MLGSILKGDVDLLQMFIFGAAAAMALFTIGVWFVSMSEEWIMEYFFILFGIVCIPLILFGFFVVYKIHKTEREERQAAHGL